MVAPMQLSIFSNLDTSLSEQITSVNNKMAVGNCKQFRIGFNATSRYIDLTVKISDTNSCMLRVYLDNALLAMYETTNGGSSWSKNWDKTLT